MINATTVTSAKNTLSKTPDKTKEIFIIEDDKIIAQMLEAILKRRGYKVRLIDDGHKALAAIADNNPPDLILLDIVLPYVDGYKVLEKLCATNDWKDVPKVMITSNSTEPNIVKAFETGADDYITKPIQIEELVVRVNRFLR